MKNPFLLLLIAGVCLFGRAVYYTPVSLIEMRDKPGANGIVIQMLKKGILLEIKDTLTDDSGTDWYYVRAAKYDRSGYVPKKHVRFFGNEERGETYLLSKSKNRKARRKRLEILKKNPGWPHRIKKAVRNGAVCLKMTRRQLTASWGAPVRTAPGFIVGMGEVTLLYFKEENPITVIIQNNGVVGWSENP